MAIDYKIDYDIIGDIDNAEAVFVWGHGWGFNKRIFLLFAQAMAARGASIIINFPGWGGTPEPPENWTTAEYAELTAELIEKYKKNRKVFYIGHSFGGRIGLQLGGHYGHLIDAMVLLASAGIPKPCSLLVKWFRKTKVFFYKFLKPVPVMLGIDLDKLKNRFGSVDYRASSPAMRKILNNVVGENLSKEAENTKCPVLIIYGDKDTETPVEIGKILNKLIKGSSLVILKGQDHHSILMDYKYPVIRKIADFVGDK
ncbi:MAG: alpha/beta hydrolase [Alphaproteobacteria bacterium]|nr:alpha/beta hydrolase [Alphaproteobacteria bacterium]MCL2505681.1 alpha/beta hydrolase [Alphaproteobacteria bacterium]